MPRSDASSLELEAFIKKVEALPPSTRLWVQPIYQALALSEGRARPVEVVERIYTNIAQKIRPGQWAYIVKTRTIPFARKTLNKLGGLAGERGYWEWTPLGQEFWKRMKKVALRFPSDLPELSPEETGDLNAPTETVEVTSNEGYQIPILQLLADGPLKRSEIYTALQRGSAAELLPGDHRIGPGGQPIFVTRAGIALSSLGSNGETRNIGHATWELTDAGRSRLHKEQKQWTITSYRGSQSKVRQRNPSVGPELELAPLAIDDDDDDAVVWHLTMWTSLQSHLGESIYAALHARIRPDLGPTPDGLAAPIPRNLIFSGPPGTGKTHTAFLSATALTGEARPSSEGRFQTVQFHPSYTYEDFVYGLRPDLEKGGIHYKYYPGSLLQICERAANDPDRFYVLVVDEINRGDPSRIFGETLFAMEYRGHAVSLAVGASMIIPQNLVILGTMNSVDRSIALMDFALRRRFGFIHLPPAFGVVRSRFAKVAGIDHAIHAFENLNAWLKKRLSTEHVLGHSYLLNPAIPLDQPRSLELIWQIEIRPLLKEYLYHDHEGLAAVEELWLGWLVHARKAGFDP